MNDICPNCDSELFCHTETKLAYYHFIDGKFMWVSTERVEDDRDEKIECANCGIEIHFEKSIKHKQLILKEK